MRESQLSGADLSARRCSRRLGTCRMEPPATPPWRSSTSEPGLLTSNDRITIICGGDVKSLCVANILL